MRDELSLGRLPPPHLADSRLVDLLKTLRVRHAASGHGGVLLQDGRLSPDPFHRWQVIACEGRRMSYKRSNAASSTADMTIEQSRISMTVRSPWDEMEGEVDVTASARARIQRKVEMHARQA